MMLVAIGQLELVHDRGRGMRRRASGGKGRGINALMQGQGLQIGKAKDGNGAMWCNVMGMQENGHADLGMN